MSDFNTQTHSPYVSFLLSFLPHIFLHSWKLLVHMHDECMTKLLTFLHESNPSWSINTQLCYNSFPLHISAPNSPKHLSLPVLSFLHRDPQEHLYSEVLCTCFSRKKIEQQSCQFFHVFAVNITPNTHCFRPYLLLSPLCETASKTEKIRRQRGCRNSPCHLFAVENHQNGGNTSCFLTFSTQ